MDARSRASNLHELQESDGVAVIIAGVGIVSFVLGMAAMFAIFVLASAANE